MKHLLLAICLGALTFGSNHANAESSLGFVIGDPTGLSGRTSLDSTHSLEGALAYGLGHRSGLHLHGTYLWDQARTFHTQSGPIYLYYGLGARLISIDKGDNKGQLSLGPRAPLGVLYKFQDPKIEIFSELSATLDIIPSTAVDLDLCIGARIRF